MDLGCPLAPEPPRVLARVPAGSSVVRGAHFTKTSLATRATLFNCCHLALYRTLRATIFLDSAQSWWTCRPSARISLAEDVSATGLVSTSTHVTGSRNRISSTILTGIISSPPPPSFTVSTFRTYITHSTQDGGPLARLHRRGPLPHLSHNPRARPGRSALGGSTTAWERAMVPRRPDQGQHDH